MTYIDVTHLHHHRHLSFRHQDFHDVLEMIEAENRNHHHHRQNDHVDSSFRVLTCVQGI